MAPRPRISALLIDLSGTLHVGSSPTPGAVKALARLRSRENDRSVQQARGESTITHIPYRFCSNTSKEGSRDLVNRLRHMGFDVSDDHSPGKVPEIWTSLGAVKMLLTKKGLRKPFCLLEESAKREVLGEMCPSADTNSQYDSVVVGLAPSLFAYEHLNAAFRILLSEPQRPLIATHRAKYIRTSPHPPSSNATGSNDPNSTLSLGPGPFIAALEYASGTAAEVVGKPTRAFYEMVIDSFHDAEHLHAEGAKIAIIGDDVESDLGKGAVELGLWRVLVKTGKYRPGDECRPGVIPPDEVCESFAAFVDSLIDENTSHTSV